MDGQPIPAFDIGPQAHLMQNEQNLRLYLPSAASHNDGFYHVFGSAGLVDPEDNAKNNPSVRHDRMQNRHIELRFDEHNLLQGVYFDGVQRLDATSLLPFIRYGDSRIAPTNLALHPQKSHGGQIASVRIHGPWGESIPDLLTLGHIDTTFSLIKDMPYLFVQATIAYPTTACQDSQKGNSSMLMRAHDRLWVEAAPLEMRLSHRATKDRPVKILKRNFMGVESAYEVDYFRHSDQNLNLDNVNNHITAEYVGIVAQGQGMAIAMDQTLQANFAFLPMRITYNPLGNDFSIRANPFGTYYGRQVRVPTWGNGQGYELTILSGEQFRSAGPTYNGAVTHFFLMVGFFDGEDIPKDLKQALLAFAQSPVLFSLNGQDEENPCSDTFMAKIDVEEADLFGPYRQSGYMGTQISIPLSLKLKVLWAQVTAMLN
jgi:hypothetical protein